MRIRVGILMLCGVWLSMGRPASLWGDELRLRNGEILEGIIVNETDTQLEVQISASGFLTLDRSEVSEIRPGDAREREQLQERWHAEFSEAHQKEEKRRAFEASQRAQGLITYRGQWVTEAHLALLKEEEFRAERERYERTVRRLEGRVETLTEKNEELRTENVDLKRNNEDLNRAIYHLQTEQLRLQSLRQLSP